MKQQIITPIEWVEIKNIVEFLCSVPQGSTVNDVAGRVNALFRYAEKYNMANTLRALENKGGMRGNYGIGSVTLSDQSRNSIVIKLKPLLEAFDRDYRQTMSDVPHEDGDAKYA